MGDGHFKNESIKLYGFGTQHDNLLPQNPQNCNFTIVALF